VMRRDMDKIKVLFTTSATATGGRNGHTEAADGSVKADLSVPKDDDWPGNRGKMPSEYAKTLGARLRAIRTQQGLSLHGVEEKSRGRWKAVVVGSYERGDRSVTVQKLAELAEFYGVPVSELLPGDAAPTPIASAPKLVIDLERMNQLPKEKVGPLARYVATIQAQRGDYNGRVLSVRHEDLRSLAVIYDKSPADLTEELISWGVLDADARSNSIESF
jgi:transcriptional regulator with XRE-family HTH domain